jgi:hypothetical protein
LKWIAYRVLPAKVYLQVRYYCVFKRFVNFKKPIALNEKLQWKKPYGYRPIHTTIADKYRVREYVRIRIGGQYLVPLLSVLTCDSQFDLGILPECFVLKANHGSGQIRFVRNKHRENEKELKTILKKWMKENHYHETKEPQYRDIKPLILIEQFLTEDNGNVPMDYKFHCFNGKVEIIQVDIDRFGDHRRNLYDVEWNLLPFTWSPWDKNGPRYPNGKAIERPQKLVEMIDLAETLSIDFDYIRVDLYYLKNHIYFGELTLHMEGGWGRFDPFEFDAYYGEKLELAGS